MKAGGDRQVDRTILRVYLAHNRPIHFRPIRHWWHVCLCACLSRW